MKKSNLSKKQMILIGVAAFIVIGLIGAIFGKSDESTKPEPKKEQKTTVNISKNFKKAGYEKFESNWRKDEEVNGTKMYKYFYLDKDNSYFEVSDEAGNSTTYFFNSNFGGEHECKYDFSTNEPKEGASCSNEEINNVKSIKDIFSKELKTIGIKVKDLK